MAQEDPDLPVLLTVPEFCRTTQLSRARFYELLAAGKIESLKIGRSRRIERSALDRFIARHLADDAA